MYEKPKNNYDFTMNSYYKQLIRNSGEVEDEYLLKIIQDNHEFIDLTLAFNENLYKNVPIKNELTEEITFMDCFIKTEKFNSIDDVLIFTHNTCRENTFFIYSYLNLELKYISIDLKYNVNGLQGFIKKKRRKSKIKKILCKI